jgi:hypothetical protein
VPLSSRVVDVFKRRGRKRDGLVFTRSDGKPLQASLPGQQQKRVREMLKFPRLGEAGADAFTIIRLMGHSTVTVSQRYVHPSPEAVELAFGRMISLILQKVGTKMGTPDPTVHGKIQ